MNYEVTRKFISGNLKGLTYTGITSAPFQVGEVVKNAIGGSDYKIISVKSVEK